MWNPDFLHRTKRMMIFPPGAGQSPDHGGSSSRTGWCPRLLGGQPFDLIVHLDRIEDRSLLLERTHSSTQSGMPSSDSSDSVEYPKIYNFEDWVPRVVDVRSLLPRHPSCHLPLAHVP
jgi:hypothetical protein